MKGIATSLIGEDAGEMHMQAIDRQSTQSPLEHFLQI